MLDYIIGQTNKYIDSMPKGERKKYGQFFTSKETALFMANLYSFPQNVNKISVLDAGAGTGILSCALIEVIQSNTNIKEIELTCYENDYNILQLLEANLLYIQNKLNIEMTYRIITENYITSQYLDFNNIIGRAINPPKYDLVIGNPPYMKISKDATEAVSMPLICYGAPNIYFIFAAMGLFNLKENGEMVYIIPRSWTSGAYFKKFRKYFLTEGKLEHIHLFVSRNKVFDKEEVLQETMIIKIRKTQIKANKIAITSSVSNNDFDNVTNLHVPYDDVVSSEDYYVYLATNNYDIETLEKLNKWKNTLPSIGLKMKTGLTVDFRNREILREEDEDGAIPLFYSQHIKGGIINFPIQRENEYIVTEQNGLKQDNKNYLFVKRFTAKEEKRRLQSSIYLSSNLPQYTKISTQNKINFIDGLVCSLSEQVVFGLYVLFNSSLYDSYYRILNGSTQVNSTEINAMPVPPLNIIEDMGRELIISNDMSVENCDIILEGYSE